MRLCCCLLVLLAVLLSGVLGVVPAKLSPADVQRLCSRIETAPHSIASCADPARVGAIVDAFRAKTGLSKASLPVNPVILLPGLAQSGLQAELDRETTPEWYCVKKWDWYEIWVDIYELLAQPCLLDNMMIQFFPNNGTYGNQTGVSIRPNDFGGLDGVNQLDHFDDPLHLTSVYATMIAALEEVGYKAGVTLYGAPYDWRLPFDYLFTESSWDEDMVQLVQSAYKNAGNNRVWLVTHSMGGPTALYFMNSMGAAWVSEYIAGFIPIAGPWSGSPDALRTIVEGNNFGLQLGDISFIDVVRIANLARQSGGVGMLVPDEYYWPANQTFISTPSVNYTLSDLPRMFADLGTNITEAVHQETLDLMDKLQPPTVPTYCLYGYNVSTLIGVRYAEDFAGQGSNYVPKPGELDMSNMGDGTVPLESLQGCKAWIEEGAGTLVNCQEYNLGMHSTMLKDVDVLSDVLAILSGTPPMQGCNMTPAYDSIARPLSRRR